MVATCHMLVMHAQYMELSLMLLCIPRHQLNLVHAAATLKAPWLASWQIQTHWPNLKQDCMTCDTLWYIKNPGVAQLHICVYQVHKY